MYKIFEELYEDIKDSYYKYLHDDGKKFYRFDEREGSNDFIQELSKKYLKLEREIRLTKKLDSNKTILYRGIKIEKARYLKNLVSHVYTFHRPGVYGMGQYLSYSKEVARYYACHDDGNILQAVLDKDINIIYHYDLMKQAQDFVDELFQYKDSLDLNVLEFLDLNIVNPRLLTILASALDYDAITEFENDLGNVCVINPNVITYLDITDELDTKKEEIPTPTILKEAEK